MARWASPLYRIAGIAEESAAILDLSQGTKQNLS